MPLVGLLRRGTSFFTTAVAGAVKAGAEGEVTKETLFPLVTCEHDGDDDDDCDHDCAACPSAGDGTSGYGKAFDKVGVDNDSELYGGVKKYSRHVIVATGETDWVRDVEDIKGSVMEALGKTVNKGLVDDRDGRLMISASNMHPPQSTSPDKQQATTILLLPSWTLVENVTPATTPELISRFINPSPTNLDPLSSPPVPPPAAASTTSLGLPAAGRASRLTLEIPTSPLPALSGSPTSLSPTKPGTPLTPTPDLQNLSLHDLPYTLDSTLRATPFPHDTLILICSHKRRDARCGISAPILRKEFERHLRPLGLWRDLSDMRAGGVKVLFINHVGGHKFSANVIIYRKQDREGSREGEDRDEMNGRAEEAMQGIWLAKIAPRHVEGIVKHTILEGRVCDSGLLRAGFDRKTGLNSW
ncbi:hypothetical protein Q9L58_007133 [Maublancomyces gigas]|uniref:Sucrase/ferredoxin-like-domain-containing protein n=1 Tax=Discina gigas TaxID=1032678 RepID=A0ABR3GDF8_9PEZI